MIKELKYLTDDQLDWAQIYAIAQDAAFRRGVDGKLIQAVDHIRALAKRKLPEAAVLAIKAELTGGP